MVEIFGSNPFEIVPHLAALVVAYLLAFPVGWNREKEERSAGLRTFPLVAMAACGFVQAAETMMAHDPGAMARVLEGIIAGMGFIGGGAILKQRNSVKGTATAASLWATGAMGVAVGLGSYDVALVLSVTMLLTLWVLSPLKPELVEEPRGGEDDRRD